MKSKFIETKGKAWQELLYIWWCYFIVVLWIFISEWKDSFGYAEII